ncbi:MAG: tubulin-like doman-containing protein, partial [Chloroflexi bacterium]|nr:tubulin-like doman-containing protein [Chloroflexota bacterium]
GVSVESDTPPFTRGCYLIDTRNEKSLTLKDQDEMSRLAGEWVFRTALTPLKSQVDEFSPGQGTSPRIQGQLAAYNSFGLASYVLPIEDLIRRSASRMSEELIAEHLLKPELFARVSDRLDGFFTQSHLRPDDLINVELRQNKDGKPIKLQSDSITRLKTLPHDQIVTSVQTTINAIGKEMLPALRSQIEANTRRIVQEAGDLIDQEVATVLKQWPAGGLSLAMQLVWRLREDAARFTESLNRREAAYQCRNQQQVNFLARQGPTLKNAVASIPPLLVAIPSLVVGILVPLALASSWLWQTFERTPETTRVGVLAAVWLLALGGVAYAAWQSIGRVEKIRDQYVTYLQNRFETELSLALVQAAHELYPEVSTAATFRLNRLSQFSERMHRAARQFKRGLGVAPLCGEIDFALQRSVLTPELVDTLYQRYLGQEGVKGRMPILLETYGTLDNWLAYSVEDIQDRVFYCCKDAFEAMRELRAEAFINGQMAASQPEAERLVRDLLDKAVPLCVFNAYNLGQVSTVSEQTFVGMEAPAQSELRRYFEQVNPAIVFESLGDRHSLTVTTIRRGIPLFGLVRIAELRRNYLDALREGGGTPRGLSLHLEDELALVSDLKPLPAAAVERAPADPALVFALGVAFGMIQQRAGDGVYTLIDEQGDVVAVFSRGSIESVVLMGADDKLLARLDDLIQSAVAERSVGEVAAELEAYVRRPQVSAWERRRIEHYVQLLRG